MQLCQLRNLYDVRRRARKDDNVRLTHGRKPVVLIEHQIFIAPQYAVLAYDSGEFLGKSSGFHTFIRGSWSNLRRKKACLALRGPFRPLNPPAKYISAC